MDWLMDPEVWPGLMTLTALEIVLGIDNLVFVAILVARVQPRYQPLARNRGLGLALGTRLVLLAVITWVARLIIVASVETDCEAGLSRLARFRGTELPQLSVPTGRSVTAAPPQPTQFITISAAVPSSGDPTKAGPLPPATPVWREV